MAPLRAPGMLGVVPRSEDQVGYGFPYSPGPRQSHVIMTGCCGDTPGLAFSRPGW